MTTVPPVHGANDPISLTLGKIAGEALHAMQSIAECAAAEFQRAAPAGASAMGAQNDFNSPEVGRNLGRIQSSP